MAISLSLRAMRKLLRTTLRLTFWIGLAAIVWSGWYVCTHGFSKKWRLHVIREFRERGLEVYVRRLTLDPLHGLVARDVQISDPSAPGKYLAVINRATLEINLANLWHGEPFLDAIDLRDAELALPLDPADLTSPRVEISRLNARVLLPPHQIYLSEANARIFGVEISARGHVLNPEALHTAAGQSSATKTKRANGLVTLLEEVRRIRFEAGPPQIEIKFEGDAADPRSFFAEATVWGQNIRRGNYELENVFAALRFQGGAMQLLRCTISDRRGVLEASGSYDFATRSAEWSARSTLDLASLVRLARSQQLTPVLDELVFYDPPTIDLSGEATLGHAAEIKLAGSAALKTFGYRSAIFEGARASFSYDGERWYVRDFHLRNQTGEIALNALQTPGSFQSKLESTINPGSLLPLLSGKAAEMLSEWDFQQAPKIALSITGPQPDFSQCETTGTVQLGRTRLRGVPLNSATAKLRVKDKAVTYENFKLERDEGVGTGTFTYDFGKHEVRLEGIKTSLNTADVATWITPELAHDVAPYRFKSAPRLALNGVVQFEGGKNTSLEVLVDAPGGLDYTFLGKSLSFPKISARLGFTDGRLRITDLAGSLYGGWLRGDADISLAPGAPGYAAQISAEKIDFAKLTKLYFNYENSRGLLNGAFDFRGQTSDARTLEGKGELSVIDGNVFAIPVLGPFSAILNGIVPGMGYNIANKASARFTVRAGVIETDDFLVNGKGFDMLGGGQLFFLDDKLDFTIRLNAQGLPGVLLFPMSKLFEYVSDGSLSKPVWRPRRLPAL